MHDATDIRAQLEEERRIIGAATEGPWVALGNHIAAEVKTCTCAGSIPGYGHEQYCGLDGPLITGAAPTDAEFFAHARTALPARNAQIEAVLALHKPHWDNLPWWRRQPNVPGCTECYDEGYPFQYPCATVRAIEEAGK